MITESETTTAVVEKPEELDQLVPNKSLIYRFIKRTFDIVVSTIGLVICFPILLVAGIAIKIDDPEGTIFYSQPRIGLNGSTFSCHKLRSMYSNADEVKVALIDQNEMDGPVFKIRNDPRVTKVGRFIRKWSIDEFPQLLNVLKGDMSLVGPRPLPVVEELSCNVYQRQREMVKPGITCYWQVSGRNTMSFAEWIEFDLKYIREQSIWTDLKLLFMTIPAVLSAKGAS